ncbi:hypothetical protein D3C73_1094960 [compost metagenome]
MAYKVNYSAQPVADSFATDAESFNPALWLQDVLAPFHSFIQNTYSNAIETKANGLTVHAAVGRQLLGNHKHLIKAEILVGNKGIEGFAMQYQNKQLKVKWETSSV